jgi:pimeloyl-ACP methyl ester carboxylesterase
MAHPASKVTSVYVPLVKLADGLAARIRPGPGDNVLWLHDYPLDSSSWGKLWEMLPEWHHIGVDLPGYGVSPPLRPSEDLSGIAERIAGVAISQDVRHLIALGFGSTIAMQMVIRNPGIFTTLVLASPAIGGGPFNDEVVALYLELQTMFRIYGFGAYLRECLMEPPSILFRGLHDEPDLWNCLWRIVGRHGWWELTDGSLFRFMNHQQSASQLRQVEARTLVLVGEHDLIATRKCAEIIVRAIPQSRYRELKETGNLCILQDPKTAYEAIREHLQGSYVSVDPKGSGA